MSARRTIVGWGKQLGGQTSAALHSVLGSRAGGRIGILMYHRLAPSMPGEEPPTWNVTPDRFRSQLEGLLDRGYAFWSLRQLLDRAASGLASSEKVAVVTFDDGYRNVYSNAFPVLRDLDVPATVFVATAFMGSTEPFPFDRWSGAHRHLDETYWRPMTWDDCREMEASGLVEIGSHTHTHRDLRGNDSEFLDDLRTSLDVLRNELGPRGFTFAFPYGGRGQGFSDDSMLDAARTAGVECALTTEIEVADPRSSPFGWGRLSAEQTDTARTLSAKLAGWYDWMGHGREALRRIAPRRPA